MKNLLCLVSCVVIAYGCKPANKEYQTKIDDSDTRKTIEQKEQEVKGKPGTKLFNITRLEGAEDDVPIIIPIAISLEIKERNVLEKAGSFLAYMAGAEPTEHTKIIAKIKDLRHKNTKTPLQKLSFNFYTAHDFFRKSNKYGTYFIRLSEPSVSFPTKVGRLVFISKKTGGRYEALLVKETTSSDKMTGDERLWMLGNIIAYYSEGHTDYRRYVEINENGHYRLKWGDDRFATILVRSNHNILTKRPNDPPNYISDKALINSRIYEIFEKIKEQYNGLRD